MNPQTIFYTGGALAPDYPHYVLRQADQAAIRAIDKGKLIYTIAPRQMGKTSLLKRLAARLEDQRWYCCFVDLATFKNLERPRWFRHLGEMIAHACGMDVILSPLEDQQHFRAFLLNDVGLVQSKSTKLALFLDEVEGLLGLDFSDEFLMTLRDLYQQRDSYLGQLLIAFAGSVDPDSLVKGPSSPFNVAEEIILDDFTAAESMILTSNLTKLGVPVVEAVHGHIYGWAAGQPYLTQRICEIIEDWVETQQITTVSTDMVDRAVHNGLLASRSRDKNIKHVLDEIANLKSFPSELWKRLLAGESVYSTKAGFYALYLTGAVTEDPNGCVKIRSHIYEQALTEKTMDISTDTTKSFPEFSPRLRFSTRLKLQLDRLLGLEFEVRTLESPMGEPHETAHLPYNPDELIAILKALSAGSLDAARLTSAQVDALRRLDLLTDLDLVPDLPIRVGKALYQALFPGDVVIAFQMACNQARTQRGAVALQLRFDEEAVALARYPWELLYYRRHLLPGGAVELTRYISYPEAPTTLSIEPPLRVLHIESRPADLEPLPMGSEQKTVRTALGALAQNGLLVLEELSPPTYDALTDRIESAQDHVLHFDGHGTVAHRCPCCGAMNYPHHTTCQQSECGRSLERVPSLGYLAFERQDASHEADWVDSGTLGHLLYDSEVRVVVLSACRSSEVRGETLFGGAGPALIQAGVPAVVAMQVPIAVSAAADFMRGFYGALARFESLPAAMTSGRRRLFRGQEWFVPTLYLRSQDDEGHLFNPS